MDDRRRSEPILPEPPIEGAYDVVVVGAGPAGSTAAQAAAQGGAQVLLIDAKKHLGIPVRCGELVSQWVSRYVNFSGQCIRQRVHKMVAHLADGSSYETAGPGYMVDRSLFDRELAFAAVRSGATLSIATRAVALNAEGLVVSRRGQSQKIQAKVFIAADGAHSTVARCLGLPPLRMITTAQYEVILAEPQDDAHVFFHPDYEGGYGWLFPKGRIANVGVGIISEKASALLETLHSFLRRLHGMGKLSRPAVVGKTGGFVPCQSRPRTVFGKILFVGDAAGQTHPITGAGILHAVMAGQIAGRIAAETIEGDQPDHLADYERQWRSLFGDTLLYGAHRRAILEREWKASGRDFENLIKRTWVGFKAYHRERREKEACRTK